MPYQLQVPPVATDEGVLERLDELGATDDGAADDGATELGATLERILLATLLALLLAVPLKLVANLDVALIPLVLLMR